MGFLAAAFAYLIWALVPLYWKLPGLHAVAPLEVVCHRALWSLPVALLFVGLRGGWRDYLDTFRQPRALGWLAISSILISGNWLLYIWCVSRERIVEASLGYFLCPLLNVVLGRCFLGERLRPWQWVAVLLASLGVGHQFLAAGTGWPWVALLIAITWSTYGLLKKKTSLGPLRALAVETTLLAPVAFLWFAHLATTDALAFPWPPNGQSWLLASTGVVTVIPLWMFAEGAKRVSMATLGLLQYLVPSGTLALAVFLYREPFTHAHAITFGCIWVGLVIYTLESLWNRRRTA